MTHNSLTAAARRTGVSTLAALILAAALPQAGLAQTVRVTGDVALWKLNLEKSNFHAGWNTIVIEREKIGGKAAETADVADSAMLVISNRKVYLGTVSAYAADWNGMKLVQIGDGAQRNDVCSLACQFGNRGTTMKISFRGLDADGQPIGNVLAYSTR